MSLIRKKPKDIELGEYISDREDLEIGDLFYYEQEYSIDLLLLLNKGEKIYSGWRCIVIAPSLNSSYWPLYANDHWKLHEGFIFRPPEQSADLINKRAKEATSYRVERKK
jgi:hypothetical protein